MIVPGFDRSMIVQVYQQVSLPNSTDRYFACYPRTISGAEAEGQAAEIGGPGGTVYVYVIGTTLPVAGDLLIADWISDGQGGGRWVAELAKGKPPCPPYTLFRLFGCGRQGTIASGAAVTINKQIPATPTNPSLTRAGDFITSGATDANGEYVFDPIGNGVPCGQAVVVTVVATDCGGKTHTAVSSTSLLNAQIAADVQAHNYVLASKPPIIQVPIWRGDETYPARFVVESACSLLSQATLDIAYTDQCGTTSSRTLTLRSGDPYVTLTGDTVNVGGAVSYPIHGGTYTLTARCPPSLKVQSVTFSVGGCSPFYNYVFLLQPSDGYVHILLGGYLDTLGEPFCRTACQGLPIQQDIYISDSRTGTRVPMTYSPTAHVLNSVLNGTTGPGWVASNTTTYSGCARTGCPSKTVTYTYTLATNLEMCTGYQTSDGSCPQYSTNCASFYSGSPSDMTLITFEFEPLLIVYQFTDCGVSHTLTITH